MRQRERERERKRRSGYTWLRKGKCWTDCGSNYRLGNTRAAYTRTSDYKVIRKLGIRERSSRQSSRGAAWRNRITKGSQWKINRTDCKPPSATRDERSDSRTRLRSYRVSNETNRGEDGCCVCFFSSFLVRDPHEDPMASSYVWRLPPPSRGGRVTIYRAYTGPSLYRSIAALCRRVRLSRAGQWRITRMINPARWRCRADDLCETEAQTGATNNVRDTTRR